MFYAMHHVTHFFHEGDCEKIAGKNIRQRVVSLKASEKIVSNDVKTPNEIMSEMGSLDLGKNKVIDNLGENRFF